MNALSYEVINIKHVNLDNKTNHRQRKRQKFAIGKKFDRFFLSNQRGKRASVTKNERNLFLKRRLFVKFDFTINQNDNMRN